MQELRPTQPSLDQRDGVSGEPGSRSSAGVRRELEMLRAEARHQRERRDLDRARMYSGRPASAARMRELDRLCDFAEVRLSRAAKIEPMIPNQPSTKERSG